MFYVERQHRRIKRQVELIKNTTQFESSVLQRVLGDQLTQLQKFDILNAYCLHQRSMQCLCDGIPALMADSLVWQGVTIHVDDIVQFGLQHGVVIACYQLQPNGQLLLRVEILIRRHGRCRYEHTSTQQLWQPQDVQLMTAWRARGESMYDIISR